MVNLRLNTYTPIFGSKPPSNHLNHIDGFRIVC